MCLGIRKYFQERKARKIVLKMDDLTIDEKIKIQGTSFDRKRRYSCELVDTLKAELKAGVTLKELSQKYDISVFMIKYHVDDNFKKAHNAKRKKGAHTQGVHDFKDRVEYKRELVSDKKIEVRDIV